MTGSLRTSEMPVKFCQATRCYNPEDNNFNTARNFEMSYIFKLFCDFCAYIEIEALPPE
jgi:hypothetical protein